MGLCLFLSLAGNLWLEEVNLIFVSAKQRYIRKFGDFKLYESFWKLFVPRVRFAWLQDQCRRRLCLGAVTSNISACRINQSIHCHGTVYSGIARHASTQANNYVYRQPYVDCMPCALAARISIHLPRLEQTCRGKICN